MDGFVQILGWIDVRQREFDDLNRRVMLYNTQVILVDCTYEETQYVYVLLISS
jgi:hypothetical protein